MHKNLYHSIQLDGLTAPERVRLLGMIASGDAARRNAMLNVMADRVRYGLLKRHHEKQRRNERRAKRARILATIFGAGV